MFWSQKLQRKSVRTHAGRDSPEIAHYIDLFAKCKHVLAIHLPARSEISFDF